MLGLFVLYVLVHISCQIGAMHSARCLRGKDCTGTNAHQTEETKSELRICPENNRLKQSDKSTVPNGK